MPLNIKQYKENIFKSIEKLYDSMISILYPHKCPSCKKITTDDGFCLDCWSHLKFISNPCIYCGLPIPMSFGVPICPTCPEDCIYYDRIISALRYNKTIAKTIFEFKYNEKTFLSKLLSKLLLNNFNRLINEEKITIDYIIPVPIHIKRLRKRGFNQSLLLVKDLSKLTGVPYISNLIIKSTHTTSQTILDYEERKSNVKSTFKFNEEYKNQILDKNILVVDDVITTGSTINECAKILKHNKVNKVFATSIARAGLNKDMLYLINSEEKRLAKERVKGIVYG